MSPSPWTTVHKDALQDRGWNASAQQRHHTGRHAKDIGNINSEVNLQGAGTINSFVHWQTVACRQQAALT